MPAVRHNEACLLVAGFALKYAELQPLTCVSFADAVALRATEATPILLQVLCFATTRA